MLSSIISANLPFRIVEDVEFRKLLQLAHPTVDITSRKHLRVLLDERAVSLKSKLLSDLGLHTKVLLALDCWSSPNRYSFLAVMAHYVSVDWKYREVLLGFEHLSGAHTGRNLVQVVENLVDEYGLTGRLFAITADNASNNGTLCRALEQALQNKNVTWSADAMKVSCLAHVLNLSAKALLLGLKVANDHGDDDEQPELDETLPSLVPGLAANVVASTVVKVCASLLAISISQEH
jgi:hypothetical protein